MYSDRVKLGEFKKALSGKRFVEGDHKGDKLAVSPKLSRL
jgi:hypothetical protein